jgi:hypothetical protein
VRALRARVLETHLAQQVRNEPGGGGRGLPDGGQIAEPGRSKTGISAHVDPPEGLEIG